VCLAQLLTTHTLGAVEVVVPRIIMEVELLLEQAAVVLVEAKGAVHLMILEQPVQVVGRVRLERTVALLTLGKAPELAAVEVVVESCPAQAARVEIPAGLDLAPMVAAVVLEVAAVM
jgi:hypothetical protein